MFGVLIWGYLKELMKRLVWMFPEETEPRSLITLFTYSKAIKNGMLRRKQLLYLKTLSD